jgi:cytochrome P450
MRRYQFRPTFLGKEQFAQACEELIPEALALWPAGSVVDIQDLSHDLTRRCMLVVVCGDFAREAFTCLPVFHDVMDYFVKRYSATDHSQLVSTEDDTQMKRLHDAAFEVVQMFKERLAATKEISQLTRRALLFNCIRAKLSDEEMANTLVNVMIAAGEAPASGLAQTLEELARNPELQQKLRSEAKVVPLPYSDHIDELQWASGCIQEGMRLFAPATLVQRQAMRDTQLDDVLIPKGTVVGICASSMHADNKVWVEADRFNPMRPGLDFETSEGYMAFGGGPRGCPGKHAAMAICKVALPLIVSKFELSTVNSPSSQQRSKVPKFVEWAVDGIPVRLSFAQ